MAEQIFLLGKRFKALTLLAVLLNTSVVITFYYIYGDLLKASGAGFLNTTLPLIFLLIEVLVIGLTLWVSKRYASSICYRVTEKGLVIGVGKAQRCYLWSAFTAARWDSRGAYRLDNVLPISFCVAGESLQLNQYVGDIYRLADEILIHIAPYVPVDAAIKSQISAMRDTF